MKLDKLASLVDEHRFIDDPDLLSRYVVASDRGAITPRAVLMPSSVQQVQLIVQQASEMENLTLVPGLAGTDGVMAFGGEEHVVLLDMRSMNRIEQVFPEDGIAVLQPGVTYAQLDAALTSLGPPLTIGFTMGPRHATVAGGCLIGGVTSQSWTLGRLHEALIGLQVVLEDGQIIESGPSYLWESEGVHSSLPPQTFTRPHDGPGIVTKLAVRLARRHQHTSQQISLCDDVAAGLQVLSDACASGTAEQGIALSNAALKVMLGVTAPPVSVPTGDPRAVVVLSTSAQVAEQLTLREALLREASLRKTAGGKAPRPPIDARSLSRVVPGLVDFSASSIDLSQVPLPTGHVLQWLGFVGPMSRLQEAIGQGHDLLQSAARPDAWIAQSIDGGRQVEVKWLQVEPRHLTLSDEPLVGYHALWEIMIALGYEAYHYPAALLHELRAPGHESPPSPSPAPSRKLTRVLPASRQPPLSRPNDHET